MEQRAPADAVVQTEIAKTLVLQLPFRGLPGWETRLTGWEQILTDANAVACARGVHRAGCAGYRGAVVVRKPVAACRSVLVNGVYVRRCH